jgi:hypothetical protein
LNPSDRTVFGNQVLFNGVNNVAGNLGGLWTTNGTATGTHEITGFTGAASTGVDPSDLTVFNGEALFNGANSAGALGLWVTNGAAAGTHEITPITGASSTGIDPTDMTVYKGEVLFNGVDSSGGAGLWVTDGTSGGTHEPTRTPRASTRATSRSSTAKSCSPAAMRRLVVAKCG